MIKFMARSSDGKLLAFCDDYDDAVRLGKTFNVRFSVIRQEWTCSNHKVVYSSSDPSHPIDIMYRVQFGLQEPESFMSGVY